MQQKIFTGDRPDRRFTGNWARVYTVIICYLFALIAGLYVVSRAFEY